MPPVPTAIKNNPMNDKALKTDDNFDEAQLVALNIIWKADNDWIGTADTSPQK